MTEIECFLALLMGLRSHKTCNQGNKYMEMCRTILCINICNLFHEGVIGNYLDLTIKFHDILVFFTAFDVATYIQLRINKECLIKQHPFVSHRQNDYAKGAS